MSDEKSKPSVETQQDNRPAPIRSSIRRRDVLWMASGLAAVCLGGVADSAFNGTDAGDVESLSAAVSRLENIPATIGRWESTDSELSERELTVAGIEGYVRREYRNPQTGFSVHLTVLCGPAGPMSVHPPTACFQGVGYTLVSGPTPTSVRLPSADTDTEASFEFNKSSFRQGDASVPEIVRVFWGWGQDGQWAAPANPRFTFRGQPYLYKIYVVDRWLEDPSQKSLPQIDAFLRDALPEISRSLQQQS